MTDQAPTYFSATAETARTHMEVLAVCGAYLFEQMSPGTRSWSDLTRLANEKHMPALAEQAAWMRAARAGINLYARRTAGIRHKNPLSGPEGQRLERVWDDHEVRFTPALPKQIVAACIKAGRYEHIDLSGQGPEAWDAAAQGLIRLYAEMVRSINARVPAGGPDLADAIRVARDAFAATQARDGDRT